MESWVRMSPVIAATGQKQGSQGGLTGQGDTVLSTQKGKGLYCLNSQYWGTSIALANRWTAASDPVIDNLQSVQYLQCIYQDKAFFYC